MIRKILSQIVHPLFAATMIKHNLKLRFTVLYKQVVIAGSNILSYITHHSFSIAMIRRNSKMRLNVLCNQKSFFLYQ